MAKISPSDLAPSEKVHYTLANAEFDLGGSKKNASFKTDDQVLIANALSHPWLKVEFDETPEVAVDQGSTVLPGDDPANSKANDPEAVKAAEEEKAEDVNKVAIEAGKDQDKVVVTEGVAETVAAENADTKDKN